MKLRTRAVLAGLLAALLCLLPACSLSTGQSSTTHRDDSTLSQTPYTFVWMTDTQYYSESYPEIYQSMTDWIVSNRDSQNLKVVMHTGDVVNRCLKSKQWDAAQTAMQPLDGVLPYTVLAGNHDVTTDSSDHDYTEFLSRFGKSSTTDPDGSMLWYQNGKSRALLLDVGETKYLIVALGWSANTDALTWANAVINQYSDRIAIITTHQYLKKDGSLSKNGKKIYNSLVEPNPTVHLVLCGHKHTAKQNIAKIDDDGDGVPDRTVYQLIANYQGEKRGGNGFLRLLTIDEQAKTLTVQTYSPYLDRYNCFDKKIDHFTIPIDDWFS